MSPDDSHLYIADTANNQVIVANASTKAVEKTIGVGSEPERIQVGIDGRLFVSNRQSRSVSVVDPSKGTEVSRIAVGAEPVGLAMTPDGATLAVANHTSNSVSLIDTTTLAVTTFATRPLPLGVAFSNGKLYVTHDRSGLVSVLNPATGTDVTASPLYLGINPGQTGGSVRLPGQPADPVVSNGQVFVPQVHSNQSPITTTVGVNLGGYAGGGEVGSVAVVATGVATIDTQADRVMIGHGLEVFGSNTGDGIGDGCGGCPEPPTNGGPATGTEQTPPETLPTRPAPAITPPMPTASQFENVPPVILTNINGLPMSGPSAAVIEPSGTYMYITNMNSSNVTVLRTDGQNIPLAGSNTGTTVSEPPTPTFDNGGVDPAANNGIASEVGLSNGVLALVSVGRGPKGIAIPAAGNAAYVYNSIDETVSVLGSSQGQIQTTATFIVAANPLTAQEQLGQKLFFAADDSRMTDTSSGGIACASCHPNGRQDGRTWQFTEGLRNTPTLAGRQLMNSAPFHWDGTLANPEAFQEIVENRMGGTGEQATGSNTLAPLATSDFEAIFAYLDSLKAPDNPNLNPDGTPITANAASVANGEAIFQGKATCGSCHMASTDYQDFLFHNVGTENPLIETFPNNGVNTPPLRGLFYSAPYLHDGSVETLADRVADDENGQHGQTSQLTAQEKADLVAYLNTL